MGGGGGGVVVVEREGKRLWCIHQKSGAKAKIAKPYFPFMRVAREKVK